MPIRAITFDCGQTLVEVAWKPDASICEAARSIGLELPEGAAKAFEVLYSQRLPEFIRVNLLRSPAEGKKFYNVLNRDWLTGIGCDPGKAEAVTEAAEGMVFGPDSTVFKLYSETIETLRSLKSRNLVLGVISNWDYSLHRVLKMLGIEHFFSVTLASLEEGIEKPDPKLFEIALAKLGVRPEETFHVGDDPVDDVQGAHIAGIRAALIDRTQKAEIPRRLNSLLQISEAIACLD